MNEPVSRRSPLVRALALLAAAALLLGFLAFAAGPILRGFATRALMYHSISEEPLSDYESVCLRPADFEAQLAWMRKSGKTFVFADEYQLFRPNTVALTFDDGYEDNYTTMFPLLEKYDACATIFLITEFIGREGYLDWEQVGEMAASGRVKFASHTNTHQNLAGLDEEPLKRELGDSRDALNAVPAEACLSAVLSYPNGAENRAVRAAAGREGFRRCYIATASDGFLISRFTTPRIPVTRDMTLEEFRNKVGK